MSRPVRYPVVTLTLPPAYYGTVGRYALVWAAGHALTGWDTLFDKRQKSAHRCVIADKQGRATLTASIAKPHGIARATWGDVRLSDHGAWWRVHRSTLETAYGRTPFFEFYIDRLDPFLTDGVTERYPTLRALVDAIDTTLRGILGITPADTTASEPLTAGDACIAEADEAAATLPYWQVRADRLGYLSGLSVLDLIFNLGPDAPLYLDALAAAPAVTQVMGAV